MGLNFEKGSISANIWFARSSQRCAKFAKGSELFAAFAHLCAIARNNEMNFVYSKELKIFSHLNGFRKCEIPRTPVIGKIPDFGFQLTACFNTTDNVNLLLKA